MTNLDRRLTGYRYVEIKVGDTLQTIAARELNDASRWADLILINDLVYPYITGDPDVAGEQVKLYGDLLTVPAAVVQITAEADPNEVFKIDILLDNGQLTADDNGDFNIVAGRDNYAQAIGNAVNTGRRELIFHLDYGCDVRKLKGTVIGPTAALLAAEYVKSAVEADPRTQTVSSATAEVVGDALPVTVVAEPIVGTAVNLTQRF